MLTREEYINLYEEMEANHLALNPRAPLEDICKIFSKKYGIKITFTVGDYNTREYHTEIPEENA